MKRENILGVFLAILPLFFSVFSPPVFASEAGNLSGDAADSDYALTVSRKCEEPSRYNEFRKNRILFSWANKSHQKGYGERLGGLAAKEARMRAEWPGLHALFFAPLSLFGLCDWWPEELSLPLKVENQVIMANAGDDWSADMSAIAWGPQFSFRWNLDPTLIGASSYSEMAIALEHTHWSGGSGDLVNNTTHRLAGYIQQNRISFYGNEVNAVSLNFAHKFNPVRMVTVEYQAGKYLWQVPFPHFLGGFGGILAPSDEVTSYRFSGFFEGSAAWHLTPLFDILAEWKTEFSDSEKPFMAGAGVDMYTSARRFSGLSITYRDYAGMRNNSINMTRWGVWMPSQDVAYELFVNLPF